MQFGTGRRIIKWGSEDKEMYNVVLIRSNPVKPYPRLEKMASCLAKYGHNVTVLAWDRDSDYSPREELLKLENCTVPIFRIGIKGQFSGGIKANLVGLLKFQVFIFSWLKKHRSEIDVIHAYDFDTGYTALKFASKYKKKLVYDIPDYYIDSHGLKGSWLGKIIKKKEDLIINSADATIICTEERKNQIQGTNPNRLFVIHNTPNLDNICEFETSRFNNLKLDNGHLKLVYVGILGRARFIDKIAEVVATRNDCEFHIGGFGGGLEQFFQEMDRKHDNIHYYGRLLYDETIALEKACDVICAIYDPSVPNHYYAAPNKFYEALALGKPLIMARNTGMANIVESERLGEVIEYNTESLNNALNHLIDNRALQNEISKRARTLYSNKYSWKKMEDTIRKLYSVI